jgi:hypothetical protein
MKAPADIIFCNSSHGMKCASMSLTPALMMQDNNLDLQNGNPSIYTA